jgi:hypothetical protein
LNKSLQIITTDIERLEIEQYCLLQQKSFADIFKSSKIDISYLNPGFFKWKYTTPIGQARIAIASENNEMLASVAMYPVMFIKNQDTFKGWHFVEAATLPKARGRGLFKLCMQQLINSLQRDQIIYVFPNKSSLNATKKNGFEQLGQIPFYGKIILRKYSDISSQLSSDFHFSVNQDFYAKALAPQNKMMIFKDANYMNWRYRNHPHAKYYCYSAMQGNLVMGNIVVRAVAIKQQKFLLIMEFHCLTKKAETDLLIFLRKVASVENCSFAGMFSNNKFHSPFFITGMVKLPSLLLPKQHILMGYKHNGEKLSMGHWFVQTGDWDAF